MGDACLVDGRLTLSDAALAFLWARMYVVDEIKDYARCGAAARRGAAGGWWWLWFGRAGQRGGGAGGFGVVVVEHGGRGCGGG